MSFRVTLKFVLFFTIALLPMVVKAQQAGATVSGLVEDPDTALIPGATVTLTPTAGKALTTQSTSDGTYVLHNVPAGTYSMTVTMHGFASFVKMGMKVSAGQALTVDVRMTIQAQEQVVQVTTQTTQLSVDQDSNASSTTIKGKDLDALSDDPDELSSELTALAGPSAGPNGGQIYVDGFTGGQLPPKSSIREIRINQNPFSAQYERLGYGRVEVFTKPGTDKFHGSFMMMGNTSELNTGNPLLNQNLTPGQTSITQPPYHTIFGMGNITGPLSAGASFTLSGSRRSIQDNSIANGTILAANAASNTPCDPGVAGCVIRSYQAATSSPQTRTDISPRLDLALGEKNTLTIRYQYHQNDQTNGGVGGFNLASTGYNLSGSENELQIGDTQIVNSHIINETRLELGRNVDTQKALSTAPHISVGGSFASGGSSQGNNTSREARIELQNYTSIQLAKNFIRFGGRLRVDRRSSSTTAGTNGIFTYDSLGAYQANTPNQYSITKVNHGVVATVADVGLYAEDDWKVRPNLTLSYGFRYETQNFVNDHHDFAPRVSFAYGVGSAKGTPKTVLRGGFGMFLDRFNGGNILNSLQSDGINQVQSTVLNPGTSATPCSPSTPGNCVGTTQARGVTTYSIAPNLRTPYTLQFAFGADQQLFRGGTLSVNYLNARGVHQFISQNINAPVNGVYRATGAPYVPGDPSNQLQPIEYQYQSAGVFRQNQLVANFNLRSSRFYSLFGYYSLNFAKSDTAGASSFPSQPFNIGADYGRASFDTRSRLFLGGSISLPHRFSINPFMVAQSGSPYNITDGRDINEDSTRNDRPAFLPGRTSASCTDASTFLRPAIGSSYTPIPINYCTGPALFTLNMRVSKAFGFGPSTGARGEGQGGPGQGGPGPGGPGGERRGGGGGGRGGPGGGMFGGGGSTGKRYSLTLAAQFQNIFNNQDFSAPVGNLNSTNFGRSTQLAGNIYTSNSAVRRIMFQASFNF